MIPDEAVVVARRAIEAAFPYDENNEYIVRLVLETAAPYMGCDHAHPLRERRTNMNERDELTDIISTHRNEYAHITADRILAVGYRKPQGKPQPDADGFYNASYIAPRIVQPADPEATK